MSTSSPRSLALRSICQWRKNGKYANLEVNAQIERSDLSKKDRSLYTALVYGVIERSITLDYIIGQFSQRPLDKIDTEALCAAELGIYQLLYLDRIPDHAAVSETVDTLPKSQRGFVNAILREFLRRGKKYSLPDGEIERMSIEYSVSVELLEFFNNAYPDKAEDILKAFFSRHRTALRVNTVKTTAEDCLKILGDSGEISPYADDVIMFSGDGEMLRYGIENGLWFVEDTSSRLCVKVLGATPGSVTVDTCAAPGGKSFSVCIDMENRGEIHSFDLHENKISLIRKGAEKLGLDIITAEANDAKNPKAELIGKADFVLCDAPCSGLGVIGKKPDIKYKDLSEIKRLPEIQLSILQSSSVLCKKGGFIVYSTCTLNPEENEKVFRKFTDENPDFIPVDFEIAGKKSVNGCMTFFPDEGEYDGFFVSKAQKK